MLVALDRLMWDLVTLCPHCPRVREAPEEPPDDARQSPRDATG